jgi:hypothetical protein
MNLRSQILEYLRRSSDFMPLQVGLEPEPVAIVFWAASPLGGAEKELFSKIQKASKLRSLAILKSMNGDDLRELLDSLKPQYLVSFGTETSSIIESISERKFEWIESPSLSELQKSSLEKKKLWEKLKEIQLKKN